MKKTSVTKYKRTHRWNTTTQNQGFCKGVDLQNSQASRNKNLRVSHNVFSNVLPGFSKFLHLDWENRLWSWTSVAGVGQNRYFCKTMNKFCWYQLENSSFPLETILDKPLNKFEKVVSGSDLHGVTTRKRWNDYYILSLWDTNWRTAEIQLAKITDFGKISVCRTRGTGEMKNSNFGTMFSTNFSQVIPKNCP